MVRKKLRDKNEHCIVPFFTTPYHQDYNSWSKILKSYFDIGYIHAKTTFITHSLGSIFIIKFLLENKIKVKKIITVAGFNNLIFDDDMKLYESFYMSDDLVKNIKNYSREIISFYSDNDPVVPLKYAEDFASIIGSNKILVKNAYHFNEGYGYTEFNEILKYL